MFLLFFKFLAQTPLWRHYKVGRHAVAVLSTTKSRTANERLAETAAMAKPMFGDLLHY
jgi:hypothetical protein